MAPRRVGELRFEQSQVAAAEPGHFGRADFGDHGGQFAGRELRDRLQIAAVFVAEGEVMEQVFDGFEALGSQHRRAGGADAFEVREGCVEREGQIRV